VQIRADGLHIEENIVPRIQKPPEPAQQQQGLDDEFDRLPTMKDEDCGKPQYPVEKEYVPKQQR
jgi:hypothetical protein